MITTGAADAVLVLGHELPSDPRYVRGCRRVADVGVVADQFRPDRYDLMGAAIRLVDVTVILYAPRAN